MDAELLLQSWNAPGPDLALFLRTVNLGYWAKEIKFITFITITDSLKFSHRTICNV